MSTFPFYWLPLLISIYRRLDWPKVGTNSRRRGHVHRKPIIAMWGKSLWGWTIMYVRPLLWFGIGVGGGRRFSSLILFQCKASSASINCRVSDDQHHGHGRSSWASHQPCSWASSLSNHSAGLSHARRGSICEPNHPHHRPPQLTLEAVHLLVKLPHSTPSVSRLPSLLNSFSCWSMRGSSGSRTPTSTSLHQRNEETSQVTI